MMERLERIDPWRPGRGLELLEQIGSPEACRVLTALAHGASGARLTQETEAALDRLSR